MFIWMNNRLVIAYLGHWFPLPHWFRIQLCYWSYGKAAPKGSMHYNDLWSGLILVIFLKEHFGLSPYNFKEPGRKTESPVENPDFPIKWACILSFLSHHVSPISLSSKWFVWMNEISNKWKKVFFLVSTTSYTRRARKKAEYMATQEAFKWAGAVRKG